MAEEHPSPPEDLRRARAENQSLRSQIDTLNARVAETREELAIITGQRDRHYRAMRQWRFWCIVAAVIAIIELLILVL